MQLRLSFRTEFWNPKRAIHVITENKGVKVIIINQFYYKKGQVNGTQV